MVPKQIIMHHSLTKDSGTVSWDAIRHYHVEELGWDDVGYTYGLELIDKSYEILAGRMLNETGAHTRGHNRDSVGICLVGNFDLAPVPEAQWKLATRLVAGLLVVMNTGIEVVHGHRDYASYKSCPGKMFNMDEFRHDVEGLI